jgi:hypothetical protein
MPNDPKTDFVALPERTEGNIFLQPSRQGTKERDHGPILTHREKDVRNGTQRYMHLSPAATEDAIRLLDGRQSGVVLADNLGDILDTQEEAKLSN